LEGVRFARRKAGSITLHVAEAGPADGRPVILLHGCPEFWFGWRHQIDALAKSGCHVIAPDQRGYNLSDKPRGVAAYDLDLLAADILSLADSYGASTFDLVGHDWGAAVAWWIAQQDKGRLRRLVVMNAPHPAIWRLAMDNDPEQRKLSAYVRFMGIPWLPELSIRLGSYRGLVDPLKDSLNPPSREDIERYRAAWSQPYALTGMINWYRALLRRKFAAPLPASISVPTTIIWGLMDKYARPTLAEASRDLCTNAILTVFPTATHWVAHDEADRVNEILLDVLK
jgi:pimeloyl-ACP methyl ester carboxylesterase